MKSYTKRKRTVPPEYKKKYFLKIENYYGKKILEQFETPVEIHSNKRKVLFVHQGHKYYKKIETLVYIKWSCYIKPCVGSFKIRIEDKEIFDQKDHNHDFSSHMIEASTWLRAG